MIYDDRTAIFVDYEHDQIAELILPNGLIAINVSGGLDSTVVFYAVCQYIKDLNLQSKIEIIPIHAARKQKFNTLDNAENIFNDIIKKYPDIKIRDLEVFFYDQYEYSTSCAATTSRGIFYKNLYDKNPTLKLVLDSHTSLPSIEIVEQWENDGGIKGINPNRLNKLDSIHHNHPETSVYVYRPFAKIDKKLIKNMFDYLKLPKEYITTTWSCTGYADKTKNFIEPCKRCWHCWEKKWAFGHF